MKGSLYKGLETSNPERLGFTGIFDGINGVKEDGNGGWGLGWVFGILGGSAEADGTGSTTGGAAGITVSSFAETSKQSNSHYRNF